MNKGFSFSEFSKQSPKGLLIIYLAEIYKVLKLFWIFLFILFKDFSKFTSYGIIYIYLGVFVLLSFLFIRSYLIYLNFQFKVFNDHFILKKGILKKTNIEIPFQRIQNINFKQNIVQQLIGVFEVNIETAGSNDTEIAIKALSLEKATALKKIVSTAKFTDLNLKKEKELEPILTISPFALLKVSLTENHLQNLLLFLAVLFGFFNQIQQVSESLGQSEVLGGLITDSTSDLSTNLVLLFIVLVLLTLIALLSSFVKVFLLHFNLTAYLKKDAFEINQGLFTKKTIVLKKEKIQTITFSTNPLKRAIGISFVTFKQALSGKTKKKKKERPIRLVGCKQEQLEVIKNTVYSNLDVLEKQKVYPNSYYAKRLFIYAGLFLLVVYSLLYFIFNHIEIAYSLVLVLPITILLILKKIKKRFYKISDSMIVVGKGVLETHLIFLNLFKVQHIQLKQSIFQKKSKVATIILQTASGKINLPCISYLEAIQLYNHTLYKVETSKKSWM